MENIELTIKRIDKETAIDFINQYHYTKKMPHNTRYYLGVFDDKLSGVITLGYGVQALYTIRAIFYKHNLQVIDYIEIGKMCFSADKNNDKSFGSRAISALVKWLKSNTYHIFLYTMADGIMGKCGYVYQAGNFKYVGKFKTEVYMDLDTNEKIHPLSQKGRELLKENIEYEGRPLTYLTQEFCEYKHITIIKGYMFRFIYPLTKEGNKILGQYDDYKKLKNPKNSDLKFEKRVGYRKYIQIEQPKFISK